MGQFPGMQCMALVWVRRPHNVYSFPVVTRSQHAQREGYFAVGSMLDSLKYDNLYVYCGSQVQ